MRWRSGGLVVLLSLCMMVGAVRAAEGQKLSPNERRVLEWNSFAAALFALHTKQLQGRTIRETARTGGYAQMPEFYREVDYVDAATGRLLSRIQWERAHPDRVHTIEVYVHDDAGQLRRDYMAWYLPPYRNAPRSTAINIYQYAHGLQGWRQFDASGTRTYEKCTVVADRRVVIELSDEDRIDDAERGKDALARSAEYRRCFGELPKTAGPLLVPQ